MTSFFAYGPEGFDSYRVEWSPEGPSFERVPETPQALLIPGFVDMHIHGAFGIDFMSASEEEFEILCRGLEREGYEAFFPTTVTASATEVLRAIEKMTDHPLAAGVHLEGPFISPARPGAQPPDAIEEPPRGPSGWDAVFENPRLRIVTLAPERPYALELTARLIQHGIHVNMGHTDATFEEARRGYEFGARGLTHMFNAMRGFHHREAGVVGYGLANDDLYAELIYDRFHVCKDAAALLLKVKGPHRVIAVSDGTKAIGLAPGDEIDLWGHRALVGKREVRLTPGNTLAGSAITLRDAFENLAEDFGWKTAIQCCCLTPRAALGWTHPPRVWLEIDKKYRIAETHKVDPRKN